MLFETLTSKNPREKDGGCCIEQMGEAGFLHYALGHCTERLSKTPTPAADPFRFLFVDHNPEATAAEAQRGPARHHAGRRIRKGEKTAISSATSWAHQIKRGKLAPGGTYIGRKGGVQAGPGGFDLSTMTSKEKSRVAQREPGVKSLAAVSFHEQILARLELETKWNETPVFEGL